MSSSSTSSTGSSSSTSSSLFTPLQFTGISQYSSDFQSILSRATSIAQLPVIALQNQVTTITQEETDLTTLGSAVSAVGNALTTLGNLNNGQAATAVSSDTGVVTASVTGATSGTSYAITNVSSIASAASETSSTGYSDTSTATVSNSSTGEMELVYGTKKYDFTLAAGQNNLAGVKAAIDNSGLGVTASILNTGGTDGNYLSVTANTTGSTTLQLIDDPNGTNPTNILTNTNQGADTIFDLNTLPIDSSSTTVTGVVPGMTLNFAGKTAANETVSLAVSTDNSQISSALQTLVSSYNTLATQEEGEMGTSGGSLNGNNIIYQIRQAMSSIVQYQGANSDMGNLANLGIEMSTTGQMSFNQQTFDALSSSQISSGLTLLGSSTTGIGGLQQIFSQITDPTTGTIATQQKQWQTTATNLSGEITTKVAQIQANEQILDQELQAADASVADLASQQNILSASITSLDYTSYGYNTNISSSNHT